MQSDWLWDATVTVKGGASITVGTISRHNGAGNPTGFGAVNWFALGYAEWTNGSGLPIRHSIIASAAISGGAIVLTFGSPPAFSVGQALRIYPGCDRLGSTCLNKFANYANFRGFEFMPAVAPNFIVPQRTTNAAKK